MNIPIITYHAVEHGKSPIFTSPEVFEAQLTALADIGYQPVSLADVLDWQQGDKTLPEKAVVITFDDGYASVYDIAWPRLRTYGFRATAFLVTDHCGRDNRWPSQQAGIPERPLMTWDQVEALAAEGWEFGAHTQTHTPLPSLSSAQAEAEVLNSKETLGVHTQQDVRVFSYPYGATSTDVSAIVKRHFDGAVGVNLGLVSNSSDPYFLERIDAYYLPSHLISVMASPAFRQYLNLRQGLRVIRRRFQTDWDPLTEV